MVFQLDSRGDIIDYRCLMETKKLYFLIVPSLIGAYFLLFMQGRLSSFTQSIVLFLVILPLIYVAFSIYKTLSKSHEIDTFLSRKSWKPDFSPDLNKNFSLEDDKFIEKLNLCFQDKGFTRVEEVSTSYEIYFVNSGIGKAPIVHYLKIREGVVSVWGWIIINSTRIPIKDFNPGPINLVSKNYKKFLNEIERICSI